MWDWNTEESKRKWLINSFCLFYFVLFFLFIFFLMWQYCVWLSVWACVFISPWWNAYGLPTHRPRLFQTPCCLHPVLAPVAASHTLKAFGVFSMYVFAVCAVACVCACKSRCFCKRRKEIFKKKNNNGGDANVLWKLGEQVWPHAQRSRYKWALLSEP